jgi:hypothetical protein
LPLNTPGGSSSGSNSQAGSAFSKPKQHGTFASPAQRPAAAAAAAAAADGTYCFPPPSSAAPARKVAIPTSFSSPAQYLGAMQQAAAEEVELRVAEVARTFHRATAGFRCARAAAIT